MKRLLFAAALAVCMAGAAQGSETRMFKDAEGLEVQIPVAPSRIVALHDLSLAVPLVELGIIPVGSAGRTAPDGSRYLRGAATLTGINFDNSDIVDIGGFPADLEVVASLNPDLILMMHFNTTDRSKLAAIAPTIMLEDNMRGDFVVFDQIAEITGTQDRLVTLKSRYSGQISQIKKMIDTSKISVSVFGPSDGKIVAWNTYGSLGKVLRDAKFTAPQIIDSIEGSERVYFDAEQLVEFDADYIFTTYDHKIGETPESVAEQFEQIVPGFCDYLKACRNQRMYFLPREDAVTRSYEALGQMSSAIMSVIGGQGHIMAQK